jgi:hypothetical protein
VPGDFLVAHANLLRPTADDPADRIAARTLLGDAVTMLLAVGGTLFNCPAPASNSSYIFGIDSGDPSTAEKHTDYVNTLNKIKDALTGKATLGMDGTNLPANAQASLVPLSTPLRSTCVRSSS